MGALSNLRVRGFVDEDRVDLRRLFLASRRATFVFDSPNALSLDDFDQATKDELILVAETEGRLVGFASIWQPDSFLHNLFVDPHRLRQGIGRALLAACEPHFRGAAALKCRADNQNAVRFYLSAGFVVLREGKSEEGVYYVMVKPC